LGELYGGDVLVSVLNDRGPEMQKILKDAGWPGDGEGGGWDKNGAEREIEKLEDED
jgi:hypothetical protein